MNQIDLNHRYAVGTGAAQGIGLSIAGSYRFVRRIITDKR